MLAFSSTSDLKIFRSMQGLQEDTAMLVSTSLEGKLRVRPMAIANYSGGGLLYFTTRTEAEKLDEIMHTPEVAVPFQDDDRFLSLSSRANSRHTARLRIKFIEYARGHAQ